MKQHIKDDLSINYFIFGISKYCYQTKYLYIFFKGNIVKD